MHLDCSLIKCGHQYKARQVHTRKTTTGQISIQNSKDYMQNIPNKKITCRLERSWRLYDFLDMHAMCAGWRISWRLYSLTNIFASPATGRAPVRFVSGSLFAAVIVASVSLTKLHSPWPWPNGFTRIHAGIVCNCDSDAAICIICTRLSLQVFKDLQRYMSNSVSRPHALSV